MQCLGKGMVCDCRLGCNTEGQIAAGRSQAALSRCVQGSTVQIMFQRSFYGKHRILAGCVTLEQLVCLEAQSGCTGLSVASPP